MSSDTSDWDLKLFKRDRSDSWKDKKLPFSPKSFPVTSYITPGVRTQSLQLDVDGTEAVAISCFVNAKSPILPTHIASIVVLNGKSRSTEIVSRNHPVYLAQGSFKSPAGNIDWLFTLNIASKGYHSAIVNMKTFDLSLGTVILIVPKNDNAFYYKQYALSEYNQLPAPDYNAALEKMLDDDKVTDFLRLCDQTEKRLE